jgi:hypothetical protein
MKGRRGEPEPERAEVSEHELLLGRLAEDAHVGGAAVPDEVARAGRVAAVLRSLRSPCWVFSISPATAASMTSPCSAFAERPHRREIGDERALHVRDPEPVDPPLALEPLRLEAGDPGHQGSRPEYDVSMCPLNISVGPPPVPARVASTFARPFSTAATARRARAPGMPAIHAAMASSEPVKLGIETAPARRRRDARDRSPVRSSHARQPFRRRRRGDPSRARASRHAT